MARGFETLRAQLVTAEEDAKTSKSDAGSLQDWLNREMTHVQETKAKREALAKRLEAVKEERLDLMAGLTSMEESETLAHRRRTWQLRSRSLQGWKRRIERCKNTLKLSRPKSRHPARKKERRFRIRPLRRFLLRNLLQHYRPSPRSHRRCLLERLYQTRPS
jgi:chromosome segregation ATPase